MAINAHRAFYSVSASNTLLSNLTVDERDRDQLRQVRNEIRDTLRDGFRDWTDYLEQQTLLETAAMMKFAADEAPPVLRPKFKMQGSWSYDTLNRTTQDPPQEIDLDDGVFLPVSFLSQGDSVHPTIVSGAYFEAVESMLAPLCEKRGWKLTQMPSCVRVEVRDGAHVDLALYAIPDVEFGQLLEKLEAASVRTYTVMDEQAEFAKEIYPLLPSDHIMLAHRDAGWKPSDPRKLEVWFQNAVKQHGYQVRRVCRFFKGWRDFHWDCCRLSSIALMACTVTAFDENGAEDQGRDDRALLMAADRLVSLLQGRIPNPVVDGQFLDEGWTSEMRNDFIDGARELARSIRDALDGSDRKQSNAILCEALGKYMPDDPDLLIVENASASVLTTGILRGFGRDEDARQSVQLGGDTRLG